MNLRKKTLKRLCIIASVLVLLLTTAAFIIHHNSASREAAIAKDRQDGLTAYKASDYRLANTRLERYLTHQPDDVDALFAYAVSRSNSELPGNQHLSIARDTLEHLLKIAPDHIEGEHELMRLYGRMGNTDALFQLTEHALKAHPDDLEAMRARRDAFIVTSQYNDALPLTKQYAQLCPLDLDAHFRMLNVMYHLQRPQREILDYATSQLKARPDDTRFMVLYAAALLQAGQIEEAQKNLAKAIANPLPDAQFIKLLTSLLDHMHRFDDSQSVLERTAERSGDTELLRMLITRLWQDGRNEDIIQRLASIDPRIPTADTQLLALRAMALYQTHDQVHATEIVQALTSRNNDRVARAWATALLARFEQYNTPATSLIDSIQKAIDDDPDNGIFREWLGDAYWTIGEAAIAADNWQQASHLMPSWSTPLVNLSSAQLQLGAATDAFTSASAAAQRARSVRSQINLADVRYLQIEETGDDKSAKELFNIVEQVQQNAPGEPNTLPIYIALLARSGQREKATSIADSAASKLGQYDAETLLRLANIARQEELGNAEQFLSPPKDNQYSPRLALAHALNLAERGDAAGGQAFLQKHVDQAPTSDSIAWQLSLAQFYESTNNSISQATWKKLGDDHPGDLDIQRTILSQAESARPDRDFIDRTINRLKNITGEEGQQWKIERAKWLIESPNPEDAKQAAISLTEIVRISPRQIEPRIQLARALQITGNISSAIEHLEQAQLLDPRNATITIELVRLLQSQGRSDDVKDALKHLSTSVLLTAKQRLLLASMYADAGDLDRAVVTLEQSETHNTLLPSGVALLADLYRKQGQTDKADAIFTKLLDTQPSASVLSSAADFYAAHGDMSKARTIINRASTLKFPTGQAELLGAEFEERFGDLKIAESLYRQAIVANQEVYWLALIDFQLRHKQYINASTTADEASAKIPDSTTIRNRKALAIAMIKTASGSDDLSPLIDALSLDPSRKADVETLKLLRDAKQGTIKQEDFIPQLRAVADRFPQHLPLQRQLIGSYLSIGKAEEAIQIARRTTNALPTDTSAAEMLVEVLRMAERFSDIRPAAEKWKAIAGDNRIAPDSAIAESMIEQNRPADAIKQLEPYKSTITSHVKASLGSALILARAQVRLKQSNDALTLLEPVLSEPMTQVTLLRIATRDATNADDACNWLSRYQLPPQPSHQHLIVARAWQQVGIKFSSDLALQHGSDLMDAYVQAQPTDQNARYLLAGFAIALKQNDRAEIHLRTLLTQQTNNDAVINDLAFVLLNQTKTLDQAEALAQKAIELSPKSGAYYDTLARIQIAEGKREEGRKTFEKAIELAPDLVDARVGLACVLRDLGDTSSAQAQLRRAETLAKARPDTAKHLTDELNQLRQSLSRTE